MILQDGKALGRVTFGLFGEATPRTADNFRALATGEEVCIGKAVYGVCDSDWRGFCVSGTEPVSSL